MAEEISHQVPAPQPTEPLGAQSDPAAPPEYPPGEDPPTPLVLETTLLGPLIVTDGADRGPGLEELSGRAAVYATHARDGTRRAYRAAWRQHEAWCRAARAQTARRPLS